MSNDIWGGAEARLRRRGGLLGGSEEAQRWRNFFKLRVKLTVWDDIGTRQGDLSVQTSWS